MLNTTEKNMQEIVQVRNKCHFRLFISWMICMNVCMYKAYPRRSVFKSSYDGLRTPQSYYGFHRVVLSFSRLLFVYWQMQRVLHQLPFVQQMAQKQTVRDFLSRPLDPSVVSRTVFLHHLDVVDNAACSWLSLVRGINVNVFQGFATEEDLVDYFLHDAYADKVTILASKFFAVGATVEFIITISVVVGCSLCLCHSFCMQLI